VIVRLVPSAPLSVVADCAATTTSNELLAGVKLEVVNAPVPKFAAEVC
jgi:hypothetical protein